MRTGARRFAGLDTSFDQAVRDCVVDGQQPLMLDVRTDFVDATAQTITLYVRSDTLIGRLPSLNVVLRHRRQRGCVTASSASDTYP